MDTADIADNRQWHCTNANNIITSAYVYAWQAILVCWDSFFFFKCLLIDYLTTKLRHMFGHGPNMKMTFLRSSVTDC